jgi:hypothetical protein
MPALKSDCMGAQRRRQYLHPSLRMKERNPVSASSTLALRDLAGLTLSDETFEELRFFISATSVADGREGAEALSNTLDRCVREWLALQGAAIRMRDEDERYVADWNARDEADTKRTQRRITRAKNAAARQGSNVARIDAAWGFKG